MTIPTGRVSSAAAIITAALGRATEVAAIACVYCRKPIPSESFGSWSATGRRLQSTPCPVCDRKVALTEAGMHHEFISAWWPGSAEDAAVPARPALDVRLEGPARYIRVRGELDHANVGVLATAMATLLELELDVAPDRDPSETTVDVQGVSFTDATGLGALVNFAKQLRTLGARLSVVGATPELRRVFDLVGLRELAATA